MPYIELDKKLFLIKNKSTTKKSLDISSKHSFVVAVVVVVDKEFVVQSR